MAKDYITPRTYEVVVAATREMGIGKNGILPWKLPSDLRFFKKLTIDTMDPLKKNALIMGRKTWESIPTKFRPLPGRLNVVLSRSETLDISMGENAVLCGCMSSALDLLASSSYRFLIEKVFVIGGGVILQEALNVPNCDAIHLTDIESSIECDTFIPVIDASVFRPWSSSIPLVENNIRFSFVTYIRAESRQFSFLPKMIHEQHEEIAYLRFLEKILMGTEIGTFSNPCCELRFNLRRYFPLFTTKRVFWHGVVEELLWAISGSTNAKALQEKGIHRWDENSSREHLDSAALARREEGDLGPIYGFQWRHWNADYVDMHRDYTGNGIDQLADAIDNLKKNSKCQRIVLSAYKPTELKNTALLSGNAMPHFFLEFLVANGELSCHMNEDSTDAGLGVPFSIASYSLLACIIAQVCDLIPGCFIYSVKHAHIHTTHIKSLQEQLQKQPRPFPILKINSAKKNIDSFVESDFTLVGYDPHE